MQNIQQSKKQKQQNQIQQQQQQHDQQQDIFERQSQCQDYQDYAQQGYHPVILGQKFNNKYIVQQKLGWGHFSTVWLVYNQINQKYSALKIQKSKQSYSQSALDQLQMLKRIRDHENDQQWILFRKQMSQKHKQLISQKLCQPLALQDNFIHHGIHGKHYCSVFELMGPNLLDLIQHYQFKQQRMPLWLVRKITIDILMGLVHLHDFSRIIHTDLKPQNIMMKLHPQQEIQLIKRVKQYKVKPLSMKYLKNLQASKSSKNKKKYQKKKLKKKQQKEKEKVTMVEKNEMNNQGQQENLKDQKKQELSISLKEQLIKDNDSKNKIENPHEQHNKHHEHQHSHQNSHNKSQDKKQNQQQPKQIKKQSKQKQQENAIQQDKQKIDMSILKWKNMNIKLNTDVFFKIADMGNACFIQKHFTENIQTREYRSPQVLIGHQYYPNTDVWSLACVVFEMLTNNFLFKPKKIQGIPKDQDHLYKIIQVLGPMNKQFATTGTQSARLFNKKGKLLHGNPKDQIKISTLLVQDYGYELQVAQKIQRFLLPMLQYEPKNRISAKECLKAEWLWQI